MTVSLALLVKDPPLDRLARLLDYVRPVVTETVAVVDDRTANETVDILSHWEGVTVVPFSWCDDFAAGRNAALPHCTGDWILHLDPDEWPTPMMLDFIAMVDASEWTSHVDWHGQRHVSPRGYLFWTTDGEGRSDINVEHDWHCRLFRRTDGWWYKRIHEQVALSGLTEDRTRETPLMAKAPRAASFRHDSEASPEKRAMYERMEALV
jgi:glycosyltransferase involved in cell wall biosynthesis